MIFRQFIDEDLGCASYLIGDAGEAAVVDPSWDAGRYLDFAASHRLRITRVLETHTHADHVSGRGRIAAATGAELFVPAGARAAFAHETLGDRDAVTFGDVRIEAIATPGHRPEHVSYVVTDGARGAEPSALLAGDSLLVGDVARPDLAVAEQPVEQAARSLHDSLRRLALLPDHVELWPGHIGGSLCCGTGTSEKPSSTIGFERRANRGLVSESDRFVDELLTRLPDSPPTVAQVVELNRGPLLEGPPPLPPLPPERVARLLAEGCAVVDGRSAPEFDAVAIPGSLCLPLDRPGVGTKAAWLLAPGQPVVVVAGDADGADRLAARLAAVGISNVLGRLAGGIDAWRAGPRPVASVTAVDVETAARLLAQHAAVLVDVRDESERAADPGPAGSLNIPWREGAARAAEARAGGRPILVACASGARTPTAASVFVHADGPPVLRLAAGGAAELRARLERARAAA